jgi:hypothetical protein
MSTNSITTFSYNIIYVDLAEYFTIKIFIIYMQCYYFIIINYFSAFSYLAISYNSIILFTYNTARGKIWTYNLNIFRVPLYQVELLELKLKYYLLNNMTISMETSGLDPEITICKIAVLPIKLYPLTIILIWIICK